MTAAGALGRRGSGREPGPLPFLALLVPVVSLLVLLVPGAGAWCEAERVRLAEGELWRLAGAHLAHYSSAHWLLDALVFLVLALECERRAAVRTRLALAGAALVIPAGVLAFQPELARYRGLSGLDSALFGLLLALELRAGGSRRALVAGVLFLAKVAWELATGRALFLDSQSLGFTPVPLAHALGALIGVAGGLSPTPGRRAARWLGLAAAILITTALQSCGRDPGVLTRPVPAPALAAPVDRTAEIALESSKPAVVEKHHAVLLTRFEGVTTSSCSSELTREAVDWAFATFSREVRGDEASWLSSGFPKGWTPSRTWVAGPVAIDVSLRYFELGAFTYCIGRSGRTLGWSSTADPGKTQPIEHDAATRQYQDYLAVDAAAHDGELVLVHDGASGLHEIVLRAAEGALLVDRRRSLARPAGQAPALLAVGSNLVLVWSELLPAGGLMTMYRPSGSREWSAPQALTVHKGGPYACAARGNDVLVVWPDDRFWRQAGFSQVRTGKLFASVSRDAGRTWSPPACLQDPEENRGGVQALVTVLASDERWLIMTHDPDGWWGAPDGADVIALSRGLESWAFLPGKRRRSIEELLRGRIAREH